MIIRFLKAGFSKNLVVALSLLVSLEACRSDNPEAQLTRMFVTTNSGSLYCLDLATDSVRWQQVMSDSDIDELTYMAIYKEQLIKDYLDGTIVSFDKTTGHKNWIFKDSVSKDQAFYGYNFDDVRFVHFYQRPSLYQDQMLFANSHGEVKSISIMDRIEKWNYQTGVVLLSEPLIAHNAVYQVTGYQVLKLEAATGKELAKFNLEEGSSFAAKSVNGLLYVQTEKGRVYCLDQELQLMWTYTPEVEEGSVRSELFVTDNSVLLSFDGLCALDSKTGEIQWKLKNLNEIRGLDLLERDEYVVLTKDTLLILDKKGKLLREKKWSTDDGQPLALTAANSSIYMLTYEGALYKVSADLDKVKLLKSDLLLNNERGLQAAYFLKE